MIAELFGGIGAIRKALINLNIPYKVVDYVEIDKNATKAYNTLYGEKYEPKDIVGYKIDADTKIDILMHGSPCQDFSRAGEKKGGEKGSETKSSLLFETVRIISEMNNKPTFVIWENVKGVLDRNFKNSFFHYLEEMKKLGYESKYKILNAYDFGIPQKRERIFVVSKLGSNSFDFENLINKPITPISQFLQKEFHKKYIITQPSLLACIGKPNPNKKFDGRLNIINDFAYTIMTKQMRVPNSGIIDIGGGRYRYLTEYECFRLMGFDDYDFNKLKEVFPTRENCTSSILYKLAGNSVVVQVLEAILLEIIRSYENNEE